MRALLALLLANIALAGCTDGDAPTTTVLLTENDVTVDDSTSRARFCDGAEATVHIEAGGGTKGTWSYSVHRDAGSPVLMGGREQIPASETVDKTVDVVGGADIQVTAHRSLEHDGTFTVTLTC